MKIGNKEEVKMTVIQEVKLTDERGNIKRGTSTHFVKMGESTSVFRPALCGVTPSPTQHIKGWVLVSLPCDCRNCQKAEAKLRREEAKEQGKQKQAAADVPYFVPGVE